MPHKFINKLEGKRVLIVGGSSGIGFASAEAAIEHGASVIIASSKSDKVQSAITRICQAYPEAKDRITGQAVDLSADDAEEQIVALFDFATEKGKHNLDHVIETAGDNFRLAPLTETTREKILAPTKVRLVGVSLLAKIALRYLNSSHRSSFTLTSGVSDLKPVPGWSVIAPIGAAKKGLTHALAHDMKPIRVNCVCPGAVRTELFNHFAADQMDRILASYVEKTLTGHIGTPEDLAEVYLCVMKNDFITGTELYSDGGYLLC